MTEEGWVNQSDYYTLKMMLINESVTHVVPIHVLVIAVCIQVPSIQDFDENWD